MNASNLLPVPPRPAGYRRWPMIIIGLLLGHVVIMMVAVFLATRDRGFVVIPNYYQRASRWDSDRAELRASDRLGWQCMIVPADQVDPVGRRAVAFTLRDASGNPITRAEVRMDYYHPSHASERAEVTFQTDAQGAAALTLPMRYAGFWEFALTATHDGHKFVWTTTCFVDALPGGRT